LLENVTRWRGSATPAVIWCTAFAAVHIFWVLGGQTGLASSAGPSLAARRPTSFVVFGLWGVAIILLAAALLALWATRYPLSPTWLRVARVAAALVAIALLLRGVYVELALATDLGGVRQTVGPLETHWSLTLWNPWFILGAFCFFALSVAIKAKANHGEKKAVGEN
jgi:hypothetical protein